MSRLLGGALISTDIVLSSANPNIHKALSEWALEFSSSSSSADICQGGNVIRLMPSEEVALQALCGKVTGKLRDQFLSTLSRFDDLSEFRTFLQNSTEFLSDAALLRFEN